MKTPYYEVYLIKGMSNETLKKCKRKETADKFAKEYEMKHGVKPMVGKVVASGWEEIAKKITRIM